MSAAIPAIQKFMTYDPICIEWSKTVEDARHLMKNNNIRHLPVVKDKKVVGIISDRDIKAVLGSVGGNPELLLVSDISVSSVYKVSPQTPLDEVAAEMASQHIGSALIEDNHRLVGIFTRFDALKAIVDICHQRHHPNV